MKAMKGSTLDFMRSLERAAWIGAFLGFVGAVLWIVASKVLG